MIRRILNAVTAAGLVAMLAITAWAAPVGNIQIETKGGTVALYRVGDFEGAQFRLLQEYGGEAVTFDDTLTPELALSLAKNARNGYVKAADLNGMVSFPNREQGLYLVVQRSAPEGYALFQPFLVSLPWDGDQWEVKASPKLESEQPITGDRNNPSFWLVSMCLSAAGILCCVWLGRNDLQQI